MTDHGQMSTSTRDELDHQLATLAGAGAINCGFATETASAEQVYKCATAALASHEPFYCIYWQSSPSVFAVGIGDDPPPPPPVAAGWHRPAGYVGRADGLVFDVQQNQRGAFVPGTVVLVPGATPSPRRLGLGMTVPVLVSSPTAALEEPAASIQGIVIVQAGIGVDGSVVDARVLKPLPLGIAEIAERLVRQSTFQPSRLFGVPIPVFCNVIVKSQVGRLSIRTA